MFSLIDLGAIYMYVPVLYGIIIIWFYLWKNVLHYGNGLLQRHGFRWKGSDGKWKNVNQQIWKGIVMLYRRKKGIIMLIYTYKENGKCFLSEASTIKPKVYILIYFLFKKRWSEEYNELLINNFFFFACRFPIFLKVNYCLKVCNTLIFFLWD